MKLSGKVGNGLAIRSGVQIRIRIRIATLVRRALAEVCTVPVLLVCYGTAFRRHRYKPFDGSG